MNWERERGRCTGGNERRVPRGARVAGRKGSSSSSSSSPFIHQWPSPPPFYLTSRQSIQIAESARVPFQFDKWVPRRPTDTRTNSSAALKRSSSSSWRTFSLIFVFKADRQHEFLSREPSAVYAAEQSRLYKRTSRCRMIQSRDLVALAFNRQPLLKSCFPHENSILLCHSDVLSFGSLLHCFHAWFMSFEWATRTCDNYSC